MATEARVKGSSALGEVARRERQNSRAGGEWWPEADHVT